jgi:phenylacetate-CoA ligase
MSRIWAYLRQESLPNLYETQWWPHDKLLSYQKDRLKTLIDYAYKQIPAYRRKFDQARVKPKDICDIKDLHKLPITTREEMQDNPDFVNNDLITMTLYTGGSTGTTLKYFESFESGKIRWSAHLRGWRWSGYEYGKQRLAIVASAQGVVGGDQVLNLVGDLTEANIKSNVRLLMEYRPSRIRGYVSSLYIMARYCLDHGLEIDFVNSINTISENLYDFQRKTMEEAFGGKVFDEYVCNDGGACAWECEAHEGLHYSMERAIIEEVHGEAIVTDLWNKAMPFIRYRNGDAVKFLDKKCSCSRTLPLISVKGRLNDILISPKGPLSPSFLVHHSCGLVGADKKMKYFRSGIRTVQYIQKPGYKLNINLIRNEWCSDRELQAFAETIGEIAQGMSIEIRCVDDLPETAKGKRQFIINEDKDLQRMWGLAHP